MVWLDWLFLAIISFSMIMAFFRGLTRESIALLAWLLGAFLAFRYSPHLQILLEKQIETPEFRYALVFISIVLIFIILGALLGMLLGNLVKKIGLAGLDRSLGLVFGLARGVLVVVLFIMIASFSPLIKKDEWKQSWMIAKLSPPAEELLVWLESMDLFPKKEQKDKRKSSIQDNSQATETPTTEGQ